MINRRRLLWFGSSLLAIGVIAALFVHARRDADFVIVGCRTVQIRGALARLDSTIDAGDFHDCKTVREVAEQLTRMNLPDIIVDREAILQETGVDRDWEKSRVHFDAKPQPMTVKQFLRLTLQQTELPNVSFIVQHPNFVIATTPKAAAQERAAYLNIHSTFGLMQMTWAEWTRDIEDDDPPFHRRDE